MWHICQEVKKRGLWNKLAGKKVRRLKPIVNSYETQEIAEYGFRNIKSFGGKKPVLLKVLQE
jgi:hypothetical protein